jgi:hypothetical protein
VKSLGQPCGDGEGPYPRIGISGVPTVGETLTLYLSELAPEHEVVLVLGTSASSWRGRALPYPLPRYGGCPLRVASEQRLRVPLREIRPGEAVAELALAIPNDPALLGATAYAQWLVRAAPLAPAPSGRHRRHAWATTRALGMVLQ